MPESPRRLPGSSPFHRSQLTSFDQPYNGWCRFVVVTYTPDPDSMALKNGSLGKLDNSWQVAVKKATSRVTGMPHGVNIALPPRRVRHPNHLGTPRPERCENERDLHKCSEPGLYGCAKPNRYTVMVRKGGVTRKPSKTSSSPGCRANLLISSAVVPEAELSVNADKKETPHRLLAGNHIIYS